MFTVFPWYPSAMDTYEIKRLGSTCNIKYTFSLAVTALCSARKMIARTKSNIDFIDKLNTNKMTQKAKRKKIKKISLYAFQNDPVGSNSLTKYIHSCYVLFFIYLPTILHIFLLEVRFQIMTQLSSHVFNKFWFEHVIIRTHIGWHSQACGFATCLPTNWH